MNHRHENPMLIPEQKTAMPQAKEQTMKKLSVMIALVGWSGLALGSPVGVYVDDNFPGTSLNTGEWTAVNTVAVADSYVTVTAVGGFGESKLASIDTVMPTLGQTAVLTFTNLAFSEGWGNDYIQGFSNIWYRWGYGSMKKFEAQIGGPTGKTYTIDTVNFPGDTMIASFVINWSPDKVTFVKNGTTIFDSSINLPDQGGSWVLPSTAQGVLVSSYLNSLTIGADNIKLEVVPEPASLALLALGALPLLRRRR
ncbi:MAG: PEP-CTERM sorting domain-containing protein [Lentisphaeria bacterium]